MSRPLCWSQGGGAVYYDRDTLVVIFCEGTRELARNLHTRELANYLEWRGDLELSESERLRILCVRWTHTYVVLDTHLMCVYARCVWAPLTIGWM